MASQKMALTPQMAEANHDAVSARPVSNAISRSTSAGSARSSARDSGSSDTRSVLADSPGCNSVVSTPPGLADCDKNDPTFLSGSASRSIDDRILGDDCKAHLVQRSIILPPPGLEAATHAAEVAIAAAEKALEMDENDDNEAMSFLGARQLPLDELVKSESPTLRPLSAPKCPPAPPAQPPNLGKLAPAAPPPLQAVSLQALQIASLQAAQAAALQTVPVQAPVVGSSAAAKCPPAPPAQPPVFGARVPLVPPPPSQAPVLAQKTKVLPPPPASSAPRSLPTAAPPSLPPVLPVELQPHVVSAPPTQAPMVAAPPSQAPVVGMDLQPESIPLPPTHAPILRLADSFAAPELGSSALPTMGSKDHHIGTCKPCAFVHTKGCTNGINCIYCHLCKPGEKKRRLKEKVKLTRDASRA